MHTLHSMLVATTAACSLFVTVSSAAYVWPNPQYEALEQMFYEGAGVNQNPVGLLVSQCTKRDGRNTTVAAEWLRLAYHDMATFNITAGTGGVDASIYYELDREENIGEGMRRTAGELGGISSKYVSRADVIAMAATWSIAACNGPVLSFRGGRRDSFEAGRKGVPEPQQELSEHVESFRIQGFNATEMIALVACGHTLGGVREEDFPTIVPSNGNRRLDTFDSTIQFDTSVATEYIAGTTRNPLVVNSNQTVLSDLRIFSSDNNVTMNSLRDEATFSQTCSTLLTRMVETVPTGVTLTEIAPIPFKLASQRFSFVGNELAFSMTFRILDNLAGKPAPPKRTVRFLWCDRRGANADCADGTANGAATIPTLAGGTIVFGGDDQPIFSLGSPVTERLGMALSFFNATVSVPFERSVGKFWFVISEEGSTNVTVQDNGGNGYFANSDEIVYLPIGLKGFSNNGSIISNPDKTAFPMYIAAGVHNSVKPDSVHIRAFDNTFPLTGAATDLNKPLVGLSPKPPFNETIPLARNTSLPSLAGYDFYSAEVANGLGPSAMTIDLEATSAGAGAQRTFRVDYVFALSPIAATFALVPPLASIFQINLTSVASGNLTGTAIPPPTSPGSSIVSAPPFAQAVLWGLCVGVLGHSWAWL